MCVQPYVQTGCGAHVSAVNDYRVTPHRVDKWPEREADQSLHLVLRLRTAGNVHLLPCTLRIVHRDKCTFAFTCVIH